MNVKEEICDSYDGFKTELLSSRKLKNKEDNVLGRTISNLQIGVTGQLVNVECKQENVESVIPKFEPIKIDYDYFSTTIKQEIQNTGEVKATIISDIKQEVVSEYVPFENESELLTSHCDLPTLKNENTDYPKNTTKQYIYKKWQVIPNDYPSSKLSLNHSDDYFRKHPIICKFCGTMFVKEFEFLQHHSTHSVNNKKKNVSKSIEGNIRNVAGDYMKTFNVKYSVRQQLQKCTNEKPFKCKICSSRFTNKIHLKAHLKRSHSKRYHRCDFCFKQFKFFLKLSNHNSNKTQFKCKICSKKYITKNRIRNVKIHTNEKSFKCDICLKEFRNKFNLQSHLKMHFPDEKPFKCNICLKAFRHKSSLQSHLILHSNPVKCNICHKEFITKSHLQRHSLIHTNEKPFKCDKCLKEFGQKVSLQRHYILIHSVENSIKCNICLKQFKRKSSLQNHLIIHNEKPFKCNVCSKKFSRKFNLQSHLIIHTNKKPFKCSICYKEFRHKSNLPSHLKIHSNEKPFKCNICLKEFRHKSNLQSHLIIHSNPFKCTICNKEFNKISNLQVHLMIHSNEKPFKCDVCSKEFRHKPTLQRHLIIHTNKKPFKCNICSKEFRHKHNLQRHLITHTKKNHPTGALQSLNC